MPTLLLGLSQASLAGMDEETEEVMMQMLTEKHHAEQLKQEEAAQQERDVDSVTRGQDEGVSPETGTAKKNSSPFSGTVQLDVRSRYIPYGIVIQGEGVTIQQFVNLRYSIYEGTDFLNNITVFGTAWGDFSTNKNLSSPTSPYRNFTELDLIAGASFTIAKRYNLAISYTELFSPASAFGDGRYMKAQLVYDDTNYTRNSISFRPQVSVVYELPGQPIGLAPNAWLIEPGFTPNYTFARQTQSPINVSLPMRIGLGPQFYNGSTYGFFSVGPQMTMRIPFLSSASITTNLTAGYTYYNLGKTTAEFAPNKSYSQHNFNLGLSLNF
ncbi:hypothetical protein [Synechococcus sp. 1G10]|uniref:hypothetical protein n=1 Tax=Synechococcus sp. 1G10 TaxID=2025605 RepID=UPI001E64D9EE|nr:hypothetical protein [Synechococcus sp. 1G10]